LRARRIRWSIAGKPNVNDRFKAGIPYLKRKVQTAAVRATQEGIEKYGSKRGGSSLFVP